MNDPERLDWLDTRISRLQEIYWYMERRPYESRPSLRTAIDELAAFQEAKESK